MKIDFENEPCKVSYLVFDGSHTQELPSLEYYEKFVDSFNHTFPDNKFDIQLFMVKLFQVKK